MSSVESKLGVVQGTVEGNNKIISELRADVREIRSIVNSHLEAHARSSLIK